VRGEATGRGAGWGPRVPTRDLEGGWGGWGGWGVGALDGLVGACGEERGARRSGRSPGRGAVGLVTGLLR